ncbi:MAG: hypothetical protein BWY76_03150 [bacterium ADurb.Bin429]|nr:MAG: hypothetical protein BWY76_03150 [bacterium ADurb.Bin429]
MEFTYRTPYPSPRSSVCVTVGATPASSAAASAMVEVRSVWSEQRQSCTAVRSIAPDSTSMMRSVSEYTSPTLPTEPATIFLTPTSSPISTTQDVAVHPESWKPCSRSTASMRSRSIMRNWPVLNSSTRRRSESTRSSASGIVPLSRSSTPRATRVSVCATACDTTRTRRAAITARMNSSSSSAFAVSRRTSFACERYGNAAEQSNVTDSLRGWLLTPVGVSAAPEVSALMHAVRTFPT